MRDLVLTLHHHDTGFVRSGYRGVYTDKQGNKMHRNVNYQDGIFQWAGTSWETSHPVNIELFRISCAIPPFMLVNHGKDERGL